jgi:hypothetical protein
MTGVDLQDDQPELLADALARALNDDLVRQFGPMLESAELISVFRYPSADAYRQAVTRGTVPVPLFRIPHRRGSFALARDVATWLCRQRRSVTGDDGARQAAIHEPSDQDA